MDLTALMRSPDLALDPSPGTADVVRRRARRVRRRRQAGGTVLGVVALVAAASLVPRTGAAPQQLASSPDHGIRTATSEVLLLERLNGADVVAWFEDDELCVAAIRVKRSRACAPGVDPATTAVLPHVFPATTSALRVDDRQLLAGLVRDDVVSVVATFGSGDVREVAPRGERGFRLRLFWVEVPRGDALVRLQARGAAGGTLEDRVLSPVAR